MLPTVRLDQYWNYKARGSTIGKLRNLMAWLLVKDSVSVIHVHDMPANR